MRSQFVGKIMDRNKEILKVQRGGTAEYLLAEGNGTCASQPGQGRRRTTSPRRKRQSDIQWNNHTGIFLGLDAKLFAEERSSRSIKRERANDDSFAL
ncbi:hypothetical protein RclHR1_36790001 [Rhizophagus clarus]|uniref:Uncharacterized protein n=1 Tax=Rhizophagus clarus TaxID=94130 RepID=A0A2Z6RBS1_9GLOM|nr:hypothetical protein RclHR1_36790001 [Rhizophagus clarus]